MPVALELGAARGFNGFFLESFQAPSSDTEGRLAAGGNVSINHYSVAEKLTAVSPGATLLAGGDLYFPNGRVYHGDIVVGGSAAGLGEPVIHGLTPDQNVIESAELPFDFAAQFVTLRRTSRILAMQPPNGMVEAEFGGLHLAGDCTSPAQVFQLDGQQVLDAHTFNVSCIPDGATVIFNIDGTQAGLTNMSLADLTAHRQRVLFNFHQAEHLTLAGIGIEGSVLAPLAHVEQPQGVIDGTIMARSWDGPMQLNHRSFRGVGAGDFCALYPVALPFDLLDGAEPGSEFQQVPRGTGPGNLSWLTWAGSPSAPVLANSLFAPGDSFTYINPDDNSDWLLTPGDWAQGAPGAMNSRAIRDNLDALLGTEITVPVWSEIRGQGNNLDYQVADFARVRLLDYRLPGNGWLTFEFLGFSNCYNRAPEAVEQQLETEADTPLDIELTGEDPDGDELGFEITTPPEHGQLQGEPPLVRYIPDPDFEGEDSFQFIALDDYLESPPAQITIQVVRTNLPPEAVPLTLDTLRGEPVAVELSGTDPDGDELSFEITTPPANGTLSGTPPLLSYQPVPDFVGTDQFKYIANDGELTSTPAVVTITVIQPNRPPEAVPLALDTLRGVPVPVELSGTDPDGDELSFEITTPPVNGTLEGTPPLLSYQPGPDFVGTDQFEYVANDGELTSAPVAVTITVIQPNRPPTASGQSLETDAGVALDVILEGQDPDGDVLVFTITSPPGNGVLDGGPPVLQYNPNDGFIGTDSFQFVVNDGLVDSVPATVTIEVIRSNVAPRIVSSPVTQVAEDQAYRYAVEAVDDDGDPLQFRLEMAPDGMVIGRDSGVIDWQPDPELAAGSILPNTECRLNASQQNLLPPAIDAVLVMDGSGSNQEMWPWVPQSMADLNADLMLEGVGSAPDQNRYGLLWFGTNPEPVLFDDAYFESIEGVVAATYDAENPGQSGTAESGLLALQFAIDNYPFREGVSRNIVLVPDEPEQRELANEEILPEFVERLRAGRYRLNVITQFPIQCQDGRAALGIDADGRGYVADGEGGFEFCQPDRSVIDEATDGYLTGFVEPYVLPALELGGAVWRLSALLANSGESDSLRRAITSRMFDSVVADVPARDLSDLSVDAIRLVDTDGAQVEITLRNRGLAVSAEGVVLRIGDASDPAGLLGETVLPALAPGEIHQATVELAGTLPARLRASLGGAPDGECVLDNNELVVPLVEMQVADPSDASDAQHFAITVTDVNQPPEIVSSPSGPAVLGQTWVYEVDALDPDRGDALRFSYEGSANAVIDPSTGVLRYRPDTSDLGLQILTVRVTDLAGEVAGQTFELTVEGDYILPAFEGPPANRRAIIGEVYTFTPPVTRDPTAQLEFALLEAPEGMSIDPADGTITWVPTEQDFNRLRLVTLGLVDAFDNRDALSFVLFGDFPNAPPTITSTPDPRAEWGRTYSYQMELEDPNAREEFEVGLTTGASNVTIQQIGLTPNRQSIRWNRFSVRNAYPERNDVTDYLCRNEAAPSAALTFGSRWTWGNVFVSDHAVVAPLEDSNGDGTVDERDAPVLLTHSNVTMFALDARTGQTLWSHAPTDELRISGNYAPAVADLDGNGVPEIYTVSAGDHRLTAWDATDRSLLWQSTASASQSSARLGRVLVTDLEGDGRAEILAGPSVFDDQGGLRFQFGHPFSPPSLMVGSILTIDLDGDGRRELLYGDEARDADGNLLWIAPNLSSSDLAFWSAGDFNGDGSPELVQVARFSDGSAGMTIIDSAGLPLLGPIPLTHTGRPVIGDMTGDGVLEIFVPGENALFTPNGEILWQLESIGFPSNGSTALAADLQGNGRTELLVPAGALSSGTGTVVIDGLTGAKMFTVNQTGIRRTDRFGMPLILDTDGSGTTRVITTGSRGVSVSELLGPVTNAAPRFMHQTRFDPDGLEAGLGVNPFAVDAWQIDGTDQVVIPSAGPFTGGRPDLRLSIPEGDPRQAVRVRVSNRGTADYPSPFSVQLWAGDPDEGGSLLAEQAFDGLGLGASRQVTFDGAVPADFDGELVAALVTPDASIDECALNNNRTSSFTFDLTVADHAGATDDQSFLVGVFLRPAIGIIDAPLSVQGQELEPLTIEVGRAGIFTDSASRYFYVENPPDGLTQDLDTGLIEWTPQRGQAGDYTLRLSLKDLFGFATRAITVSIEPAANQPPVITSTPSGSGNAGETWVYQVEAFDPDGDELSYSLRRAPEGMTINPVSGLLVWDIPAVDSVFEFDVVVSDGIEEAVQLVTITVEVNRSPRITSTPVLEGTVSNPYQYAVRAVDDDGDSIVFALDAAPLGMTIDPDSGLIEWLPGFTGTFQVGVTATDTDGLTGHQGYLLTIVPSGTNRPPSIVSSPPANASVEQEYSYLIQATDPDGDPLTFRLLQAPAGMTLQAPGNLAAWVPTTDQIGSHTIQVEADDGRGGVAVQTYDLVVDDPDGIGGPAGSAPVITSTPPAFARAGSQYRYQIEAEDADGDELVYALAQGPENMIVDPVAGEVIWTPSSIGLVEVAVQVSDGRFTTEQRWIITTVDADTELTVVLQARPNLVAPDEPVQVDIGAFGTSGDFELGLTLDGQPVELDGLQATVSSPDPGEHLLIATLTNAGETVTDQATFIVRVPDASLPAVELLTPDFEQEVTAPIDVIGSVSGDNLDIWALAVVERGRPLSEAQFVATGSEPVETGVLAQIDPTLLSNGLYQVVLEATDTFGNSDVESRIIRVTGDMKVGHFSITFEDLSIPVSGIPITVTRTYDTRQRHKPLDFGHGWSIDYQNVRVQESRRLGLGWEIVEFRSGPFGAFVELCVLPQGKPLVTVTLPDGSVESFEVHVKDECNDFAARIDFLEFDFQPIDGTLSTLTESDFSGSMRLVNGNLVENGTFSIVADPTNYTLTTKDGFVFELDQNFGIRTVTDPNDNTLTYTDDGILHSSGKSIVFNRDAFGRITDIVDPMGNVLSYTYDGEGNLTAFTDREEQITQFGYLSGHFLEDIIDPRGVRAIRNEYDEDGRLIAQIDADGNRIEFTHDIEGRLEIIKDRRGNSTVHVYDDHGNVISETNALDETTLRTYDEFGNELTRTDPLGNVWSAKFDEDFNQIEDTNPLGETNASSYNDQGLLVEQTAPDGTVVLSNQYDGRDNPTAITDALGQTTAFDYAFFGLLTTITDARGQETEFFYDSSGNIARQVDPNGTETRFTYDDNGNVLTETVTRTNTDGEAEDLVTTHEYDANGNRIKTTDPLGAVRVTEYNEADQIVAEIDPLGRRTEFEYDNRGNQVLTRFPDGTTASSEYGPEGNLIAETDRAGRITKMVYDAADRLIETILPDGTPEDDSDNPRTRSEYDAAGRLMASIDERGNRTEHEYDAAGRRTKTIDALGNETRFEYDARGQRIATIDARGNRTEFEYDAAGQRTATVFADGTRTTTEYDALGRKIAETDQAGQTTRFEYDPVGNLAAVIDALDQRTEYEYDEQSNRTVQRDALGRETRWAYDPAGRMLSRTLPLGQTETFAYDAVGNQTSRTDFNGAVSTFDYDVNNRQIRADYADGESVTTTYTAAGRVDTQTDSRGVTDFDYDAQDRLIRISYPNGSAIEYTYDQAGNRTGLITANQAIVYGFDALNRLSIVDNGQGITTYHYDAVGNRQAIDHANGTRTDYAYDNLNRLLEVTHRDSLGTPFSRQTYTLDAAGNRLSMTELDGRRVDYTYDDLYRLTSEVVTDPARGNRTTSWAHDAVGNRLAQTDDGILAQYDYDANDRLVEETTGGQTTIYTYDANGNTSEKRIDGVLDTAYNYDSRDRLIRADAPAATLEYTYDATGIRQSKTENGVRTNFLVDPNRDFSQVIEETSVSDALEVAYLHGDDLLNQTRSGITHTYHADGLGSTRALSDSTGMLTDGYLYTAYGKLEHHEGPTDNDFLFTGEQFDQALGFYYLRARYYNPTIGRFPTMDTFQGTSGDPRTLHKYLYVHANPVNNIDPSGQITLGQLAVSTGIAATIANTAITSFALGKAGSDSDGIPDGVIISLRGGVARGFGGAIGADLVYDFRKNELWGFGAGELTIAPLTVFRPQKKFGLSATAGFVWNMSSPRQFNGLGATATWPLATGRLLARARRISPDAKGGFWGFMTQTAKLAKRKQSWSLQFGFSGFANSGPAFARIGRGTSFSSDFFGLAAGRKINSSANSILADIERIMKSLRGNNSPEAVANAINAAESL